MRQAKYMEGENKTNFTPVVIGIIIVAIVGLLVWGFFFKSPKEVLAPVNNTDTNVVDIKKNNTLIIPSVPPGTDATDQNFDYKG